MELKTYFAQDAAGNIIPSAIVNVFLQGTTTLATGLTRADGTPLENPFAADGAGRIQFRAPDGYYDVQVSAGPGIIQTLTIQCVDYSGAKADADRAEAAADLADVSAEQAQNALNSITGINTNFEQNSREQWRRALSEAGLNLVSGSFEEGATVNSKADAVWHIAAGQCYSWDGALPKEVPAGSTPDGLGLGAWVGVGDASLRSAMKNENGTDLINGTKSVVGSVTRSLTDMLSDKISVRDFGGIDDYDGTNASTCTNNKIPFQRYFEYLNSIGGGDLNIPRKLTGKYFISGDDHTQVTSKVRLNADEGVSIHLDFSGGASNTPFANLDLRASSQIKIEYVNFGYPAYVGGSVDTPFSDSLQTMNNGDGIYTVPEVLSGSDFKVISLGNSSVEIPPLSTSGDTISFNGGGVPTAAVISVTPGDEIMALISSNSLGGIIAGVVTVNGYAYVSQDTSSGNITLAEGTTGQPNILTGLNYALMDQLRDRFDRAIITVKITSSRTFTVMANGLAICSHTTRSSILGACFGTSDINSIVNVSQMSRVRGHSFSGSKPLRILVCGDSITDQNNQYSWAKYLQMQLGSAGINIAEIKNLAVSGQTAAQQLSILKTVGVGYDICLIQVGVNDVQLQTPVASFISTINEMVTYAKGIGAFPIVGVPTAFYSLAEANANGQTGGQNTSNNSLIGMYRSLLIRAVAAAGGIVNLEPMKGHGAMTAKWLSLKPYAVSDSIVLDNIHPTPYGSMLLAQGYARCILGWLTRPDMTPTESFEFIPSGWLSPGFGETSIPKIKGREFSGLISLHATNINDGSVAFTLPPSFKVDNVKMLAVTGTNSSGLPVGVCNLYVGADGKCYFFNIPEGVTQVSMDGVVL